ncbi:MAG TPA: carboxypeptidase regulatory-like domain-containing protein, partial [Bryobacteraceae bacterium]|nr:carboxypeptidase regulatory-like domain-containing protein [Bryobacteraceae bacterium]
MNIGHVAAGVRRNCLPWFVLFSLFLLGVGTYAQTTGQISGTVTDATKAPVEGATVTIVNADTGVTVFKGTTNASGIYRAANVPVGRYNISVEAPGFKKYDVSGVNIAIDQKASIDAVLELGQVAETVNVEGSSAGQLATDSSSLGGTITPADVQNLPLPSRNTLNLLALSPGVSSGADITNQGGLNTSQLSINGSRTLNSEFLLDGVSVVTGSTGSPETLPPPDSIREFKVLTSSYSAEYGRTSGAIVTLVTNSGTNNYHGAAYGYFRNEVLDANNYFNNVLGKKRPEDRYNLFGGKIGGPLSIPKLYNGKNKTFFFLNYEGLRQAAPFNTPSSLPYGAYATGNFSASRTAVDMPGTHTQFAGNIIPSSLINPAALKILSQVPAPNSSGTLNATDNLITNNYVSVGSNHPTSDLGLARLDESISQNTRLFGTFMHYISLSPPTQAFPGVLDNATGTSTTTGYDSTIGLTQTWSPTLITEVRFGFFRNNSEYVPLTVGINTPQTFGVANSFGFAAPDFNISSYS